MKRIYVAVSLAALAVLLVSTTASAARPVPPPLAEGGVTFQWISPPPSTLKVGESYTIEMLVESPDRAFLQAVAMTNAYYPGRGVFFSGGDRVVRDTTAVLQLTVKGKNPTADLPSVCDWPLPGAPCTEPGTAPLAIAVGVRYKGGEVYADHFPFAVAVEE